MKSELQSPPRLTGLLTILSGILAFGSMLVGTFAVEFELDTFSDPSSILRFSHNHGLAKGSMLLDMFGYYLLLLPVIFYLHEYLKQKTPWANTFTFCGLAYVLIGAIGAGILSAVWPQQMQQYLTANAEQQAALQAATENITTIVYGGMWNILEVFVCGVWWAGVGFALRSEYKSLGNVTVVLGIACLLDSVGNITELKMLAEIGLNIYLILAIAWAIWMGILIYKGKFVVEQ
jgi:hypothetical protein